MREGEGWDDSHRQLTRIVTPLFFVFSFVVFAFVFLRMPLLNDSDSYYHLAVARLYAQEGIFATIPWARLSLLASGGDKELLFHIFLIPFVTLADPAVGGRLALALLNSVVASIVAWRGTRALGWPGALVPLLLWLAAPPFVMRAVRLRPEWLALIIILLAVTIQLRRRERWLGALSLLFALSYTAFHVFIALSVLWLVHDWWSEQRREDEAPGDDRAGLTAQEVIPPRFTLLPQSGLAFLGRQILWPLAGAAIGLLLHPHPLRVLYLWYVQNVLFFLYKNKLNVGLEILPPSLPSVLWSSLGWVIGIVTVMVMAKSGARREPDRRVLPDVIIATALFGVLFLVMTRMATYFFPLVTLGVVEWSRAAGTKSRNAILVAILIFACLIGLPRLAELRAVRFLLEADRVSPEKAWHDFGTAVPRFGKVATDWVTGEHYAFWAPQGRYLNVLEPLFMALPYPRQYAALRSLYSGADPDVPGTVKETLRSDYLAVDLTAVPRQLVNRLSRDPRLRLMHGGANSLYRIDPADDSFIRNWNGKDQGTFVRVAGKCATFTHVEPPHQSSARLELAPYGATRLLVDGVEIPVATKELLAVPGRGFYFSLRASPLRQTVEVETCPGADGVGGFYLLRR